jgi:hypothetical protein
MIPISICAHCGGYSRNCTCSRTMAGRFGASGIHVSVLPHDVRMASATTKTDRCTLTKTSVESDQIGDQPDFFLIAL